MARLTREEILKAKDIIQEEVFVKEWNGSVLIQSLSGKQRANLLSACMDKNGKMDSRRLYPLLFVGGVIEPKFNKEDADALNEKNAGALEKVAQAVMKLSGISQDDVEEAEKNSE